MSATTTSYKALSIRLRVGGPDGHDEPALLEALASRWGLSQAATIVRALAECLARETAQEDNR